jgi:hypothetical protein
VITILHFQKGRPHQSRFTEPRFVSPAQELKKKHGIDYDSHASYRFVEG